LSGFLPLLQEPAGGQLFSMLIPFGLIILVFYFLIIRPQNKKQKDTQAMLASIRKNDRVTTIGGIRGVVQAVKDDTVIIKVDDNVKLEFSKSAVSAVNSRAKGESSAKEGEKESASEE
jgi:preprotein translocase subunit YajC